MHARVLSTGQGQRRSGRAWSHWQVHRRGERFQARNRSTRGGQVAGYPAPVVRYRDALSLANSPVKSTYQLQRHRCHRSAVEYLQAILLLMGASFEYFLYDIKPFMMLSLNTKKQVKKNHQQAANE